MNRRFKTAMSGGGAAVIAAAALTGATATPANATEAAPSASYCSVSAQSAAQWASGYALVLSVRNITDVPVRWTVLKIRIAGQISSVQVYGATYTKSGSQGTIYAGRDTGLLAPGQSTTVGVINATGYPTISPQNEVTCTAA